MMRFVPLEEEEEIRAHFVSLPFFHVSLQKRGSCLQAWKRALSVRNKCSFLKLPSMCYSVIAACTKSGVLQRFEW